MGPYCKYGSKRVNSSSIPFPTNPIRHRPKISKIPILHLNISVKIENYKSLPYGSIHIWKVRRDGFGSIRVGTDTYGCQICLVEPISIFLLFRSDFQFFSVRIGTSPKPSRWVPTHPEDQFGSRWINTGTYGYIRNLNQACQTHLHFSVFRILYEVFPDQAPDDSQPKSFSGGQAIHILLDRYKRDMAI